MLLPHNTLVLVADGAQLRLFRNAGREAELALEEIAAPDLAAGPSASGGHHHSSSANPDRHTAEEDAFAAAIVRWLHEESIGGRVDGVYVIAPPRLLGEMRRHYTTDINGKLLGELAKELVSHSVADITAAVADQR